MPARGHNRVGIRIHHSTILEPADLAVYEGIPVTSVPRTLLDLAGRLRGRAVDRVLERAERLGLLDLGEVDSLLERAGRHGGRDRLRGALDIYRDPAFLRSGPERRFLSLLLRAGLPRPSSNVFVEGHELDAFWSEERFAVEIDAYSTHGSRSAFERDRTRQANLKLAGIDLIRITAHRLEHEPQQVVSDVRSHLERRRCELGLQR